MRFKLGIKFEDGSTDNWVYNNFDNEIISERFGPINPYMNSTKLAQITYRPTDKVYKYMSDMRHLEINLGLECNMDCPACSQRLHRNEIHSASPKDIPSFIEKIQNINEVRNIQQRFVEKLNEKIKYKKQVNAFSLILTADYIISTEIFGDKPLQLEEIQEYIRTDTDETERIYNMILDWFYENINKFNNTSGIGEVWGKYEKTDEEITSIYVISKVLKDFLADNNINFNGIKEKLLEAEYLETRNREFTIPVNINGTKVRCIKINVKSEKTDLQFENEYIEQSTLEDLPF